MERLPLPEGAPLLTLHDPPGGGSFASYQNVRAVTTIHIDDIDTEINSAVTHAGYR